MKIAIMGSGGIGGYIGFKLAKAGHEVVFIARGAHLKALQEKGLTLRTQDAEDHIEVTAVQDTSLVGPVDMILFSVKLYDTVQAAEMCRAMMGDDSFILTLQNGVESVDLISDVVGPGRTVGGSIYVSANIESPGIIRHNGGNDLIRYGEINQSSRLEIVAQLLEDAKLNGLPTDDMQAMLWEKFVLLAVNAGLGAVMDKGAKEMCANDDIRPLFIAGLQEVVDVARAQDIAVDGDVVATVMAYMDNLPEGFDLIASQLLDKRNGKKLELEWLQGTLHRLGQKYGVPTPIHSMAYLTLKPYVDGKAV